jgi:hypothetical protein
MAAKPKRRIIMRRFHVLLSIVAVVLLGILAFGPTLGTRAQQGTPPAEGMEFAPGVLAYALAFAEGQEEPSLYRVTFAPGAVLTGGETDPSITLISMEAGAVTVTIDAPVAITRGGGATSPEIVEAGTAFTAESGDYFVIPPLVAGEYRNDGQEEASAVVAAIIPAGMATPAAGTPAP